MEILSGRSDRLQDLQPYKMKAFEALAIELPTDEICQQIPTLSSISYLKKHEAELGRQAIAAADPQARTDDVRFGRRAWSRPVLDFAMVWTSMPVRGGLARRRN